MNYKVILDYDGTKYNGFSHPRSTQTIQQKLHDVIKRVTQEEPAIYPAVKTEPGIHAKGQTINFHLKERFDPFILKQTLNQILPADIRIQSIELESDRFHSTLHLNQLSWECKIDTRLIKNIFLRSYVLHEPEPLNIEAMKTAAGCLSGTHDFANFSVVKSKKKAKNTIRSISELSLFEDDKGILTIHLTMDGYLRKLPQLIFGLLLAVGKNEVPPEEVNQMLDGKSPYAYYCPSYCIFLSDTSYL